MVFPTRSLVLALGCCLASAPALVAQTSNPPPQPILEPPRLSLPADAAARKNQDLADTIANQLRQSSLLKGYQIDIVCQEGVVELAGQVSDPAQVEEVERNVRCVPGVQAVVNRLAPHGQASLLQTQVLQPAPIEGTPPRKEGNGLPPLPGGPPAVEPTPLFQAAPAVPNAYSPPRMPPYAWPTYAPYNNYSRVAYPTAYPYQAWPFIGPAYPFPKIPLGWRSVSLTWQDGYWWYGRNATGHNWWQLRFW